MSDSDKSDITNVYTVKEVRLGLFRICWKHSKYILRRGGTTLKQIKLCGSQLGRAVTISFGVGPNGFQVKILTQPNVDREPIAEKDPGPKRQKLNELSKSEESKLTVTENFGESQNFVKPVKIWLESAVNVSPIEISELYNCNDTWEGVRVSHSYEVKECSIVVWIDFGTSEVRQTQVNKGLAEMLHNQTHCDVNFHFKDGQSIGAHIVILSAGSPVFAAIFQSKSLKNSQTCVDIKEIDMEVFKQLLDYLYTLKAPQITRENQINIMLLYEAADTYELVDLKKECVNMLLSQLDDENAIELLVWSKFHYISELFEQAMEMTVQNCKKLCSQPVWLDLMKKHPELFLEVTKNMAELLGILYNR